MSKNKKNEEENIEKSETNQEAKATQAPAPETESEQDKEETEEMVKEEPVTEVSDTEKLEKDLAEMKDKYLRQVAEFDNYRKRTLKEKTELILNGGEKVMTALLPIMDDLERAQQNIEKSDDIKALKEGVELVFQKLQKVLESQGLKKIETKGQDFNTDFHEAIAMIPAQSDEQKGKVVDCVQAGYMLNDKVIRHAKVAIGQ
ncbi:MAG: nucleotide exchange factor GrpE [Bacteroidaceae bacterium]|jgi:molecular chaperone GrpE|nr:nucleotide exchange factor GrpE [Bacteroidaceae bacterium]